TQFLVQETINSREVWPIGDFTVRQDERWCGYDKFQKLYMSYSHVVATCKQAHHEYRNYIHSVYTLESIVYWPLCYEPMICLDPNKKRNSKGHLVSSRIHTKIDI
ncbi:hypothetical protein glysoja_046427, partial [Glycine soja]